MKFYTSKPIRSFFVSGIFLATFSFPAFALDGKVYSPTVVKGEAELEYAGTRTFDSSKEKNNLQENQFSVGYGVTDFWAPEVYFATFTHGPGQPQDVRATEFENIIQFWPTGKYWLDAGMLASYHLATKKETADSVELKLLLQKDIGRFTAIANLGGGREVGNLGIPGNDLSSAANVRYRWLPYFEPGIEWQAGYGMWGDHNGFNEQEHYLGPIIYGELISGLKYEAGYFAGISNAAASSAARLKIEYEIHF